MRRTPHIALLMACVLASACTRSGEADPRTLPMAARAQEPASLPTVTSGQRPGPALLYADAPAAPQLENVAPWTAAPILISGTSAYRDGEFLYQDFLHDDRGAAGIQDPADPMLLSGAFLFSPKTGTLTYPSDPVFANNAADFVELRIKPLADSTAFRVTLNTLQAPERVAFTIAIGTSSAPVNWPHGAGVSSPAELFLTVHGDSAELSDASGAEPLALPPGSVSVDLLRRQFEIRVPRSAWDPGMSTVRFAAGVGLWDSAAQSYLMPSVSASATTPGGAAPNGAALFNLAFRFDEPLPDWNVMGSALTIADAAAAAAVESKWWREYEQAMALRSGDISAFHAEVDFAKLAAKLNDDSGVPVSGAMDRIFASHFSSGQGADYAKICGRFPISCDGVFVGQLQSYALYVPATPQPPSGWGLTLLLHAHSGNHNLYMGSNYQLQIGNRASGSLVLTPASRGPDGDYTDIPEADAFEAWADVARHYPLDPEWVAISGYSMGAGATYKLSGRWPDLFGRALAAAVLPVAEEGSYLPPLRNIPLMNWTGLADEGAIGESDAAAQLLEQSGLRFILDVFQTADHLTIITNNEWTPAAEFLGEHRVDRNPPHITYIVDPRWDSPRPQMIGDHAYWISGLKLRDTAAGQTGQIDVRSDAFGLADPTLPNVVTSQGVLSGGTHGPMPFQRKARDWDTASAVQASDRLVIEARNIRSLTVDVQRARLSCSPELQVVSDGPLEINLAGCARTMQIN